MTIIIILVVYIELQISKQSRWLIKFSFSVFFLFRGTHTGQEYFLLYLGISHKFCKHVCLSKYVQCERNKEDVHGDTCYVLGLKWTNTGPNSALITRYLTSDDHGLQLYLTEDGFTWHTRTRLQILRCSGKILMYQLDPLKFNIDIKKRVDIFQPCTKFKLISSIYIIIFLSPHKQIPPISVWSLNGFTIIIRDTRLHMNST
jgi:hypothetical protein